MLFRSPDDGPAVLSDDEDLLWVRWTAGRGARRSAPVRLRSVKSSRAGAAAGRADDESWRAVRERHSAGSLSALVVLQPGGWGVHRAAGLTVDVLGERGHFTTTARTGAERLAEVWATGAA